MADLENTKFNNFMKEFEKRINEIDIENLLIDYVTPKNEAQLFVDKLEYYFYSNRPIPIQREIDFMKEKVSFLKGEDKYNPYDPKHSNLWDRAFNIVDEKYPGQFSQGNIKGKHMTLIRNKPSECMISGKVHKRENSYIIITENSKSYRIAVGCNRKCKWTMRNIQLKNIGSIEKSEDSQEESENEEKNKEEIKKLEKKIKIYNLLL